MKIETEIDLKCCGNCLWCLDCGMYYPWRICVDWKSDNNTRKDRRNEKQMLEEMKNGYKILEGLNNDKK